LNNNELTKIIKEAQIPTTPKDKLDNLISYIQEKQNFTGDHIDIEEVDNHDLFLSKLYFMNHEEYMFFMRTLFKQELILFRNDHSHNRLGAKDIQLTFKGLEYVINIQENGTKSKKCFIAMSFSPNALQIRNAIKETVVECGYEPILVDEIDYDSHITINDAIINSIRKSKFVIADFSEQKHGVYFEAGFALGLKKSVIYTCNEEYFDQTHFDTNHYPHIVYSDTSKLKEKLKNKIQAWIE